MIEEQEAVAEKVQEGKEQNGDLEISVEDLESRKDRSPPPEPVGPAKPSGTDAGTAEAVDQPPANPADESSGSEITNAKLAEEVTDQILAKFLQEELAGAKIQTVFRRELSVPPAPEPKKAAAQQGSPKERIRREPGISGCELEVAPDVAFNINSSSISCDQIVAGVDTSLEAVEQYIEGIFAQIRIRGKQFMNAFYTPIYKNPLIVLSNLQRQNIGQANQSQLDLTNTLSSILNVQLYLTLEKARENVIREALQQIKDATNGQNMAQDDNLSELLSESDHIHNKAIFDAVNEALNSVRPYGQLGEPMPWSGRPRRNFFPFASEDDLEDVLGAVKVKLMEWADMRAGQISTGVAVSHTDPPEISPAPKEASASKDKNGAEKQEDKGEEAKTPGPKEEPQSESSLIK